MTFERHNRQGMRRPSGWWSLVARVVGGLAVVVLAVSLAGCRRRAATLDRASGQPAAKAPAVAADFTPRLSLQQAAAAGDLVQVRARLGEGVRVNARDPAGYTALQAAVWSGQSELARWLIQEGADITVVDPLGQSLQNLAIASGSAATLEVVREKAIGRGGAPDFQQVAAAARLASPAALAQVAGEGRNPANGRGTTALHLAAAAGNLPVVRVLVEKGADVAVTNLVRNTPLHLAVLCGHLETAQYLLAHGAPVNVANAAGYMPLHLAAARGNPEMVAALRAARADLKARCPQGTAAELADAACDDEVAAALAGEP